MSVCAHTSRCNMELLFWQTKEHFDCCFFGTEKKKDHPVPFWLICSSPLPPFHFMFRLHRFGSSGSTCYCFYTVAAPCSGEHRGCGQGTRNGTGSCSRSALIQDIGTDETDWQEESKTLEQSQHLQRQEACLFSLFLLQHV